MLIQYYDYYYKESGTSFTPSCTLDPEFSTLANPLDYEISYDITYVGSNGSIAYNGTNLNSGLPTDDPPLTWNSSTNTLTIES